jgi:hypothetical protein
MECFIGHKEEASEMKKYPDMTKLFAQKEARRRKLANLPIAEKMEIAQRIQDIGRHAPGGRLSKTKRTKWSLASLRAKQKRVA